MDWREKSAATALLGRMRAWCHQTATNQTIPPPARVAELRRCVHLGGPTGEEVLCETCPSERGTRLKLLSCARHNKCTPLTPVRGVQCCASCPDRQSDYTQLVVPVNGIGDHILALAHSQYLRSTGSRVVFVAKPAALPWVQLFDSYDEVTTDPIPGVEPVQLPQCSDGLWAEFMSKLPMMTPTVRPLSDDALPYSSFYSNHVVLCPGSGYRRQRAPLTIPNNRVWLQSHWQVLETKLMEAGHSVVVLDDEAVRTSWATRQVVGETPERVAAILAASSCVVANESGMAHLAGALGTPCVVLAGPTNSAAMHRQWTRTLVLNGPLECTGCKFTGPHYRAACDHLCASLQSVQPNEVLRAVEVRLSLKR